MSGLAVFSTVAAANPEAVTTGVKYSGGIILVFILLIFAIIIVVIGVSAHASKIC